MDTTPIYRRGDPSPVDAGLVFLRYSRGREIWVTPARLESDRAIARKTNARQRQTPKHQERMRKYFRSYNQTSKQKVYRSTYYKQRHVRERIGLRHKERVQVDVNYAIATKLRSRINRSLRNERCVKAAKTEEVLGCTVSEFRRHLQSKFTDGMNWQKFLNGEIVVDHIVPIALFDLSDEAQQKAAFNFRNCQPMWATDNLRKSDFITHQGKRIRARHIRNIIPFTNAVAA